MYRVSDFSEYRVGGVSVVEGRWCLWLQDDKNQWVQGGCWMGGIGVYRISSIIWYRGNNVS